MWRCLVGPYKPLAALLGLLSGIAGASQIMQLPSLNWMGSGEVRKLSQVLSSDMSRFVASPFLDSRAPGSKWRSCFGIPATHVC